MSARARRALTAGHAEVDSCERVLSRFDERSDLSRLNRAAGAWCAIDERLVEALRVALRAREETGGRFDPTILAALAAAGYDHSFEQLRSAHPSVRAAGTRERASRSTQPPAVPASRLVPPSTSAASARGLPPHVRCGQCARHGSTFREDSSISAATSPSGAPHPRAGPWRLAIADPRSPGAQIGTIAIDDGAVATSGRDTRRFGPDGRLHHLIDPTTGAPAEQGPLAVTVVGPDAAEAEAYATALAITPTGESSDLLRRRPGLAALLVPFDGDPVVLGDLPLVDTKPTEVTA